MECACIALYRLDGNEAKQYAAGHLRKVAVDYETWAVTYECVSTGRAWVLDYPQSEYHGGGPPRLIQLDSDGMPLQGPGTDPHR